jgi:energy-coupling factor transporter ATP-binding protein EcfA2
MIVDRRLQRTQPVPDAGYLDADSGETFRPAELFERGPLALVLGEPGSGKSTLLGALQLEYQSIPGVTVMLFDLRDHTELYISDLLDSLEGASDIDRKYLLLDSVDETRCLVSELAGLLETRLRKLISSGWRILLATRTAELSPDLRKVLELAADKDANPTFYLCPLTEDAAREIVNSAELEVDALFLQIEAAGVQTLASNPFSLRLICEVYEEDGQIASSPEAVFERAVEIAIAGSAAVVRWRQPKRSSSVFSTAQLRAAVDRIAAISTLAGFVELEMESAKDGRPWFAELLPDKSEESSSISEQIDLLRAALLSGAFTTTGSARAFVHRAIAEYLCANYLRKADLPLALLKSMVLLPSPSDQLPYRLTNVAKWLLRLEPDRFDWLVVADPVGMITSGAVFDSDRLRQIAVREPLSRSSHFTRVLPWSMTFAGLQHPGLEVQLRSALRRKNARQIALRIIEANFVPGLADDLEAVLRNRSADPHDRVFAMRILGEQGWAGRFIDLPNECPELFSKDENRQALGTYLSQVWPSLKSTESILPLLIEPPEFFYGSYSLFLQSIGEDLNDHDRRLVLEWLIDQYSVHEMDGARDTDWLDQLAASLLSDNAHQRFTLADSGLLAGLVAVQAGLQEVKLNRSILSSEVWRKVLVHLVAKIGKDLRSLLWVSDSTGQSLLQNEDIDVLVSLAADVPEDVELQLELSRVVGYLLDPTSATDLNRLYAVWNLDSWKSSISAFDSVPIRSGRRSRDRHAGMSATRRQNGANAMSDTQKLDTIRAAISAAFADPLEFWKVYYYLSNLGAERTVFRGDNIRNLPGYSLLKAADKLRLEEVRKRYLLSIAPGSLPDASSPNTFYWANEAAYASLLEPWRRAGDFDAGLSSSNVSGLAGVVVFYPIYFANGSNDFEAKTAALRLVRRLAEDSYRHEIDRLLSLAETSESRVHQIEDLWGVVDPFVENGLGRLLDLPKNASKQAALQTLMRAGSAQAEAWVTSTLATSVDKSSVVSSMLIQFEFAPERAVNQLIQLVDRSEELAAAALLELARQSYRTPVLRGEPADLIRIWVWLSAKFPASEDPISLGIHTVGPREEVAEMRNSLIANVAKNASSEVVGKLEELGRTRPDLDLSWHLAQARESARATYSGLDLAEIVRLLSDTNRRVIRTSGELRVVTLELLGVLQFWLTKEHAQAFALWDSKTSKQRNPKRETDISNWYAHGLELLTKDLGVVINREPEVFLSPGAPGGQRNDIRVQVGGACVIIELKGSWNRNVISDLKAQLLERYMRPARHSDGIYLVVWTQPENVENAGKRSVMSRYTRNELTNSLVSEAKSIVTGETISVVVHDF